jgi:hypothetical protein
MNWSYQLNDKRDYILKFRELIPEWRTRRVDKAWYKQKFEWRLEFNFSAGGEDARHWSLDHRWRQLLEECEANGWNFRRRREIFCTIFTSDHALLDHVLSRDEYTSGIVSLEYTSDSYLTELTNQICGDAITDIKFVSHVPHHRYQVYLGGFDWKDPVTQPVTEYLVDNKEEFIFKGYYQEIINRIDKAKTRERVDQWGRYQGVYDGFNFFAKSTDDILMLHMIAPGKIRKIVKLMERKK